VGALIVAPMSLPPSFAATPLKQEVYMPYLEMMFLDHGYKFFAPEPGSSHLIKYQIETDDGATLEGIFPNLQEEWPRLLYHRHFMLTETMGSESLAPPAPDELPASAPPPTWANRPLTQRERVLAQSFAEHLKAKYHARRVTLTLVQHAFPGVEHVRQGRKLDDPQLYSYRPLGTY
jgi:hypothetical protein